LRKTAETVIGEGETVAMHTGEIHSVVNETDETTLSFHVYGRHLNHTGRSLFDVEKKVEIPFVIETR
jgi:predicted metal-dependent enzyme (double-stranded beta helix superfamily)